MDLQGGGSSIQGGSGISLQPASMPSGGNISISVPSSKAQPVAAPKAPTPTPAATPATSSVTTDPNAVAYYQNVVGELQNAYAAEQGQQATGLANINNSADDQLNQLNQGESEAETAYGADTQNNGIQRESNLGTINQGAQSAYDGLMSLLGGAGSGVSSVSAVGAPQAVSLNASQQRGQADTTYNTNASTIATDESNTKQQYGDQVDDLNAQKTSDIGNYLSGLNNEELSTEQQIQAAKINAAEYGGKSYSSAEAGTGNETSNINNIESQLNDIFQQYATPTFNVSAVTPTSYSPASYSYDPTSIAAASSNPSTDSSIATYLPPQTNSNSTALNNILTGGTPSAAPVALTAGAS